MLVFKFPEEVLLDDWIRKKFPNMCRFYFREGGKELKQSLEANLKALEKFFSDSTLLW